MLATMPKDNAGNSYEEARKLRVLDNKKRFEDLGILGISKSLNDISKPEKNTTPRKIKPKQISVYELEPRRSSRARNPAPSYRDDIDIQLPTLRKRTKFSSSWASYLARPLEEVKSASFEERAAAFKAAEKLQSNLQSENPSFVKSMVRSHVYSCFWLGLPARFCNKHLPKSTVDVVLENEEGSEYEAVYISKRAGLSGGWRGFALDHKLDDGDALVFDLVEPTRFKVYIVRVLDCSNQSQKSPISEASIDEDETAKEPTKSQKDRKASPNDLTLPKPETDEDETAKEPTKSQKKRRASPKDVTTLTKPETDEDETAKEPNKSKSQEKKKASPKPKTDEDETAKEPTKSQKKKKAASPKDVTLPKPETAAPADEGRRRSSRRK